MWTVRTEEQEDGEDGGGTEGAASPARVGELGRDMSRDPATRTHDTETTFLGMKRLLHHPGGSLIAVTGAGLFALGRVTSKERMIGYINGRHGLGGEEGGWRHDSCVPKMWHARCPFPPPSSALTPTLQVANTAVLHPHCNFMWLSVYRDQIKEL